MATVAPPPAPNDVRAPSTRKSTAAVRLNFDKVRASVTELLRQGLGKYEQMINGRLLARLDREFDRWLADAERGINAQLRNIPKRAKAQWLEERLYENDRRHPENQAIRLLVDFLFQYAQRQINDLKNLRAQNQVFRAVISKVRNERERRQAILHYAQQLGGTASQLQADEKAFERWFDEEAVNDRYERRLGNEELLVTFIFGRLGELLETVIRVVYRLHNMELATGEQTTSLAQRFAGLWSRLSIESRIREALKYGGDPRIHAAALSCLRRALEHLPESVGEQVLDKPMMLSLFRTAAEGNEDVWVQCEALSIVTMISLSQAAPLLQRRITHPGHGDDIFVRRHIYKIIEARLRDGRELHVFLPSFGKEPSPFVRQMIAKVAYQSRDGLSQWAEYALHDEIPQVRTAALLAGIAVETPVTDTVDFLDVVVQAMQQDQDPFVVRVACHVVVALLQQWNQRVSEHAAASVQQQRATIHAYYHQRIEPVLIQLQNTHETTPVRRWAAQTREQAWAAIDAQARELIEYLTPILPSIKPGTTKRLAKKKFRGITDQKLGRIFAVLSQADFGYDVHRGWLGVHITRGPTFGFRLWRLIHECTHTATDKRQALRHTVGRINTALIRAPSQILGELSETKIPGEPLTIANDGTWRPFVPLPDDFVSVLNLSWFGPRTTKFYTSQGVTEVTGPRGLWKRLRAAYCLNFRFAKLATRRNWDEETYPASAFIQSMRRLGFGVNFHAHESDTDDTAAAGEVDEVTADETVTRFFATACIAPLFVLGTFVESAREQFLRFADYFGSAFENTIEQLLVFTAAVLLLILGKHFHSNYTFRQARRNIPISIGGWGTRGKSGTERLKAALIGAMGHGLVSKTTGCEAMFIHADAFGEPLEIPLFRPYDKATIWEQRDLIVTAAKLNPSVFLWECMALTPDYVDVLQRQWTCDDLATITNTYPDHEDLQGPAGHDVATTISGFVPLKSRLITSEEQMRPYVTESCRHAQTAFRGVGWLESGLVTEDILERFPYKEHPDNVALVAAMGEELGVNYEVSLKAMGDYLVPDLGVLKTHPVAEVRTRTIEFTNGMSANERFGCMGNWRRLAFDTQDPWEDPTTWVCGVVNNRADRVPRSKVFAKIIVEDMNADRFFLIGNNLKGLRTFIQEAWEEKASTLSLCDRGEPWRTEFAVAAFKQAAWDFRQPIDEQHIQQKLRAMIQASAKSAGKDSLDLDRLVEQWNDPEAVKAALTSAGCLAQYVQSVFRHQAELITALGEYQEMMQVIQNASPQATEQVEKQFRALLEKWYFRKLVEVENYDATGEEVVGCIVDETPPGFFNRTIGLQNIKGTGLDFVYRFQAWDACYEACNAAESNDPAIALRGLQALVGMPAIGQLCVNRVREVLEKSKTSNLMRRADLQVLLSQLAGKLPVDTDAPSAVEEQSDEPTEDAGSAKEGFSQWNAWVLETSEEFLDVGDSLRRRNTADAIYQDLATGRISRQRAVAELRKINKRQKGGWLTTWMYSK